MSPKKRKNNNKRQHDSLANLQPLLKKQNKKQFSAIKERGKPLISHSICVPLLIVPVLLLLSSMGEQKDKGKQTNKKTTAPAFSESHEPIT